MSLRARLQTTFCDPRTREFLFWMLPALLVGLVLRVVLTVHLPYAYFHDDAGDFLTTADRLIHDHVFELHAKKTFLVPILFTLPFMLPWPALQTIPIAQHLLGLGLVLLIGLLCRFWFRHWRVFILPLTLLAAANPFLLWYEHTLMAETVFAFTTTLVALAGTLYARAQSWARFAFLLAALFLEAGARPEGKLLYGFGIFLVALLHWRAWRTEWPRLAMIVGLAIGTHLITKTSQAGLLLYTSVARLTPSDLKCAPGFESYIAPIRADLQQRWEVRPQFPRVRDRRAIAAAVESYLKAHPPNDGRKKRRGMDYFCLKLATETCRRNFSYLPIHTYQKFRAMANEAPCGRLDNHWLFLQQRDALMGASGRALRLSPGLMGEQLREIEAMNRFVDTHYASVPWFNRWLDRWTATVNTWRFPDLQVPNPEYPKVKLFHFGVPYYFLAAGIGVIAVAARPGPLQRFHLAWSLTLLAFFYTIILTGNVRSRFRFVFEPFWFIYIALLLECVWLTIATPFRRRP